jgi:hypothetical protein
MKLTAAILIAATNAQESTVSPAQGGGRVRDKEPTATDNDAFADYFATDAFNYDAFNYGASEGDAFDTSSYEAFGDLNFGGDDYATTDYNVDADAGRPVESVDEGKSTFEDGIAAAVASSSLDAVFSERCYNGVGTSKATWLTNGTWQRCGGETEACEVKVVRRAGVISQIQSKCANQFSCVNNMRQNFNPAKTVTDGTNTWHTLYNQQACRPLVLSSLTADSIGPRLEKADSTCFFCLEPCRSGSVTNFDGLGATVADADLMRAENCIGKSHSGIENTRPIAGIDMDIMETEALLNVKPAGTDPLDATSNNYYSTVDQTMTTTIDNKVYTDVRVISKIQKEQKTFNA